MPIEQTNVIDIIGLDPATGEVTLVMTENRPWDGSDLRIFQLQEKLNAYVSFALDGEMLESYPDFAGKPIRLRLDTVTAPDPRTAGFIRAIQQQIGFMEIKFEVRVVPAAAANYEG